MTTIRVLIADDAAQVRQGLRTLLPLAGEAGALSVEVVGEAADGDEAVARALALRPDVVLMDLEMPGGDGYAATTAIKNLLPATRVVVLTVYGNSDYRKRAREANADAFVEKGTAISVLMRAIAGGQPSVRLPLEDQSSEKTDDTLWKEQQS